MSIKRELEQTANGVMDFVQYGIKFAMDNPAITLLGVGLVLSKGKSIQIGKIFKVKG